MSFYLIFSILIFLHIYFVRSSFFSSLQSYNHLNLYHLNFPPNRVFENLFASLWIQQLNCTTLHCSNHMHCTTLFRSPILHYIVRTYFSTLYCPNSVLYRCSTPICCHFQLQKSAGALIE